MENEISDNLLESGNISVEHIPIYVLINLSVTVGIFQYL